VVLDYENKGVQIWRNNSPEGFHPWWSLERIMALSEFDKEFEPTEALKDALMYFPIDCGLI
jgi:hypothetical protein